MNEDARETELARRASEHFERACAELDADTRSALRRRRAAAMDSARRRPYRLLRPLAPAGALAAAVALAVALWVRPVPPRPEEPATAAISAEEAAATVVQAAQTLDEDPEFYLWLVAEPIAPDPLDDTAEDTES